MQEGNTGSMTDVPICTIQEKEMMAGKRLKHWPRAIRLHDLPLGESDPDTSRIRSFMTLSAQLGVRSLASPSAITRGKGKLGESSNARES